MPVLHSQIFGSGEPLVILHGFLGMSDNWKRLGNQYAENGYEVHLIDQRNHGKSFQSNEFNYDLLVEDLKDYMIFHTLEKAIILGHSMGGNKIDLEKLASRNDADEILTRYIKDFGTRQFLLKNLYWVEKGKLDFRFNLKVLSDKMEEVGENISTTASFNGPTLFLRGDKSEYIAIEDYTTIKRHFPSAEIKVIDKAGHWLHAENPKQFFEYSFDFMNS